MPSRCVSMLHPSAAELSQSGPIHCFVSHTYTIPLLRHAGHVSASPLVLIAMLCRCYAFLTELRQCLALLNQTIPLRCPSMRHCSIALLLPALPLHPAAQLIYAMPMLITASLCLHPSTLNQTMPLHIATRPCQTMPLRCFAKLCLSVAMLCKTMPLRRSAFISPTTPVPRK